VEKCLAAQVGAGHGKLGFLVLRQLQQLRAQLALSRAAGGDVQKIVYIMSDAAASNVKVRPVPFRTTTDALACLRTL
jgi:hypothetical protein